MDYENEADHWQHEGDRWRTQGWLAWDWRMSKIGQHYLKAVAERCYRMSSFTSNNTAFYITSFPPWRTIIPYYRSLFLPVSFFSMSLFNNNHDLSLLQLLSYITVFCYHSHLQYMLSLYYDVDIHHSSLLSSHIIVYL